MQDWQKSWAQNKYWIMSRSQHFYNEVRLLAKENQWNDESQRRYQFILDEVERMSPTKATLTTAYQHVWGYFKKVVNVNEIKKYQILLNELDKGNDKLGIYLVELTDKYGVQYLLDSVLIRKLRKEAKS